MKQLQKLLVVLSLLVHVISASHAGGGFRALLTHADADRGLAELELLRRMARRAKVRAAATRRLLSRHAALSGAEVRHGRSISILTNEYLLRLGAGTPPQEVALTLDTGSDLVWTQCGRPCPGCFPQRLPLFRPSGSSTFAALPCGSPPCRALPSTSCAAATRSCAYAYRYSDKSVTVGQLATDAFAFHGDFRPRLAFGCGRLNRGIFQAGETGIAGFGLGRWSLPSQLNAANFSYCLTSMSASKNSLVMFDTPASLYRSANIGRVQTMPFLARPAQPSLYFLAMEAITVGKKRLPMPGAPGGATAIIDSGASITTLAEAAFELVKAEFVAQLRLPPAADTEGSLGLDLCFELPPATAAAPAVPRLALHFAGGAEWEMPRENYVVEDAGERRLCVVLDGAPGEQSTIGNFQQQNMHVLYDLERRTLSFAPARCDQLVATMMQ